MGVYFFPSSSPSKGSFQWCCAAVFCTLSMTKPGTPDVHHPDHPLHAVDSLAPPPPPCPCHPILQKKMLQGKMEMLPLEEGQGGFCPFGKTRVVPVFHIGRGEGCLSGVSSQLCFCHFCCSVDKPLLDMRENC